MDGAAFAHRRTPVTGWTRDGSAQRAHVPGLARGLFADRPARFLLMLRGLYSHRGLDVQSAREMAEDDARHTLAASDFFAELSSDIARLAAGSQRLQPSGPRFHRFRHE